METICQKEMAVTHFVNGRLTDTAVRVLLSGPVDNQFSVSEHHAKIVDALSSHLFYMNNDDEIDSNALGVYTNHITLPPEHRKLLRKIQFKKATAADRYSCICCSLEQELEKDLPPSMTLEIIINDNPHRNVLAAIFDQEINTPKYLATVYMVGDSGSFHSFFLSTDQQRMDGKAVFIISEKNPESDRPRIDLELSPEQGIALYMEHGTLDITLLSEFFDKQAIFNHSYLSK